MKWKMCLAAMAAVSAVGASAPAWSQQGATVKAGLLTCNASSGWGFVFGSTTDLNCTYEANGHVEQYAGKITRLGVDIGYHQGGVLAWAVLAPTADVGKGALAGTYVGVTAGATVGVGASGNLLVGGSNNTINLQPLSVGAETGLNIAAGVAGMTLNSHS
jgi:hypothetical protein